MQKLLRSVLNFLLLCQALAIIVALDKEAYGYVDPGSGLLVFQVAGSMVAGAIFCLRNRIRKLLKLTSEEEQLHPEQPIQTAELEQ
jgi:hypothetical protein